jgi:hypothetical protein
MAKSPQKKKKRESSPLQWVFNKLNSIVWGDDDIISVQNSQRKNGDSTNKDGD